MCSPLITSIPFKPAEDIIYMRSQHRCYRVVFVSIPLCHGFCEKGHRGTELQRTVCFAEGTRDVDIMLVFPIAIHLEFLVDRVGAKLTETIL